MEPQNGLRILAADEDEEALERTVATLGRLGHEVTATAVDLAQVTEAIAREDPHLSVVVVHDDAEHALNLIEEITAFASGPVIALIAGEPRSRMALGPGEDLDGDRGGGERDRSSRQGAGALERALEPIDLLHEPDRLLVAADRDLDRVLQRVLVGVLRRGVDPAVGGAADEVGVVGGQQRDHRAGRER